jgi:hypothetical protein
VPKKAPTGKPSTAFKTIIPFNYDIAEPRTWKGLRLTFHYMSWLTWTHRKIYYWKCWTIIPPRWEPRIHLPLFPSIRLKLVRGPLIGPHLRCLHFKFVIWTFITVLFILALLLTLCRWLSAIKERNALYYQLCN